MPAKSSGHPSAWHVTQGSRPALHGALRGSTRRSLGETVAQVYKQVPQLVLEEEASATKMRIELRKAQPSARNPQPRGRARARDPSMPPSTTFSLALAPPIKNAQYAQVFGAKGRHRPRSWPHLVLQGQQVLCLPF